MVKHLRFLQGGLFSLYIQQGEISVELLRCHLNCCPHLPYQKLSTENKKHGVYSQNRNNSVLYCFGDNEKSKQYEQWYCTASITCSLIFRTGSQAFTQWK